MARHVPIIAEQIDLLRSNAKVMGQLQDWRSRYGSLRALPPAVTLGFWDETAPWVYGNVRAQHLADALRPLRSALVRRADDKAVTAYWDAMVEHALGQPDEMLAKITLNKLVKAARGAQGRAPVGFNALAKELAPDARIKAVVAELQQMWPRHQAALLRELEGALSPTPARGEYSYQVVVDAPSIPALHAGCRRVLGEVRANRVEGIGYSSLLDVVPAGRSTAMIVSNQELAADERARLAMLLKELSK